ncbi:replication initiation protein [Paracoccus shandongensis]|uniref:replication initiation protein n=1 Tax=Paracoccus shandongensis TaxID=2816048 RepID=UPI001A8DDEE1|nr:replication initiation protein [Paracoccus shandongensis]
MREITVPSSAVALRSDKPLTPAMVSAIWELASALDAARIPAEVDNSIWLEVPSRLLRGEDGRNDNIWLRECLTRLTGVQLSGEWRGDPWGAVLLAEWKITQGGSIVRALIPPAGVHALRSPQNFAKIEARAAHSLTGHGRQLYVLLADKKRLGRPFWTFTVDELRSLMGVTDKKSYERWNNFRQWVLDPALAAVNDYGTVEVSMTPEKQGRAVHAVTFRWRWKDPHDAAKTVAENERHQNARRRQQDKNDAPPLIADEPQAEPALIWWHGLTPTERKDWADRVGRTFKAGDYTLPRRDADLARAAFSVHDEGVPPRTPK